MAAQAQIEFGEIGSNTSVDSNARVLDHLPLVKAIAVQLCRKVPDHVDLDDLIQAGTIGLIDAAKKYDSEQVASFRTYAAHRIRGAILDSLREADWASRQTRRRHRQVEEVTRELTATLKRPPSEAEIAEHMGMPLGQWRQMMLDVRLEFVSPGSPFRDNDDPVREFPDKVDRQPESMCARAQLHFALKRAIGTLTERERELLALYYHEEIPMSEISQRFGVHQSRTSQIHKAAVQKIGKVLRSTGITSSQAC